MTLGGLILPPSASQSRRDGEPWPGQMVARSMRSAGRRVRQSRIRNLGRLRCTMSETRFARRFAERHRVNGQPFPERALRPVRVESSRRTIGGVCGHRHDGQPQRAPVVMGVCGWGGVGRREQGGGGGGERVTMRGYRANATAACDDRSWLRCREIDLVWRA